jgi:hypothetical protein
MARSKRIQIAETTLERLGRILSEKWGIKVIFQGDKCETTGRVIYLPVIPDNVDDEFLHAMQGYLDHEASHCVDTDFSVFQKLKGRPKLITVFNVMEDPRIEDRWCKRYPGARLNLDRAAEWAYHKVADVQEVPDEQGNKTQVRAWDNMSDLGKFLYACAVYTANNFSADHWFIRDVIEPDIMALVKDKAEDLFKCAIQADTSWQVIPLAEELLRRLNEEELAPPEEIKPEDIPDDALIVPPEALPSPQEQVMRKQPQHDPNAPQQMVVVAQPSQSSDDENAETGQSQPQQGSSSTASASDDESAQPSQQSAPTRNFNATDEELAQDEAVSARKNQFSAAARQAKTETDTYMVYTTEGDTIEKIKPGSKTAYGKFAQQTARLVSPMKRRLVRVLTARKQSRWEEGKERGKINKRHLYRLVVGTSKDVFRQQVLGEDLDAAVLLAIDHSDSMSGEKLVLASQVAAILGEICSQLNIPFAVYGWSTGASSVASQRRRSATLEEQEIYKRWGNLWLGEYKSFADSWQQAGAKVLTMPAHCQTNTYDGESVKLFARMLLARKEKRKVLMILNDGQPYPNFGDDRQAHVNYAHACAKEVEKLVETVVFGVMTDAVRDIYSNSVVINNLNDLPKECLSRISALLQVGKVTARPSVHAA